MENFEYFTRKNLRKKSKTCAIYRGSVPYNLAQIMHAAFTAADAGLPEVTLDIAANDYVASMLKVELQIAGFDENSATLTAKDQNVVTVHLNWGHEQGSDK